MAGPGSFVRGLRQTSCLSARRLRCVLEQAVQLTDQGHDRFAGPGSATGQGVAERTTQIELRILPDGRSPSGTGARKLESSFWRSLTLMTPAQAKEKLD